MRTLTISVVAFLGMVIMPEILSAEELSVAKTVYLEKGNVVEPNIIVRTHNNGFIIAGGIGTKDLQSGAWATKTDSEGNAKWRYVAPPRDELSLSERVYRYSSAAVMPDDSVFLCGFMPRLRKQLGLLTHLNKDGKVLDEQLLSPQGDEEKFGMNELRSCAVLGNDFLVVGTTVENPFASQAKYLYWVMLFDMQGKMKWEKLVPVAKKMGGWGKIGSLQALGNNDVVFASSIPMYMTELVRVNRGGDIAGTTFDGAYMIALPTQKAADVQLVSLTTEKFTKVTLNNNLHEIGRITEPHETGVTNVAYRLLDQSLMLFGSKEHGDVYFARIMSVDSKLNNERKILLGKKLESAWTNAGVPLDSPYEFAAVRGAIDPTKFRANRTPEQLEEGHLGVALDFIKLK